MLIICFCKKILKKIFATFKKPPVWQPPAGRPPAGPNPSGQPHVCPPAEPTPAGRPHVQSCDICYQQGLPRHFFLFCFKFIRSYLLIQGQYSGCHPDMSAKAAKKAAE